MVYYHRYAGAGRGHHGLGVTEYFHETAGQGERLPSVPGVEGRLATTGLRAIERQVVPGHFQKIGGCKSHLGQEAIYQAGNEEGHFHGGIILQAQVAFQKRTIGKAAVMVVD